MRIPKKLKIGGHEFIIKLDKTLGERKNLLGECDTSDNIIVIDANAVQSQQEATLIHEIFHALNTTYDSGANHALMDSLAEQFYAVLKENNLLAK